MTTPFPKNQSTQVAEKSILDLFGRQTYLGNYFIAPTIAHTVSDTNEFPIFYIKNPSTSSKSLFLSERKLASSGRTFLKFYANPTLTNNGGEITPLNLRPAYGTQSVSNAYLYPTAAAAVAQVTKLNAFGLGSTYDVDGAGKAIQLFDNGLGYYFWISVSDGGNTQTDPHLVGTGTEVSVAAASTAAQVATAVYNAIAAISDHFTATNTPAGTVNITNLTAGALPTADSLYLAPCTLSITTPGANIGSGTFIAILTSIVEIESLSSVLFILDPGYSMLITATCPDASGGSPVNVFTENIWYEI